MNDSHPRVGEIWISPDTGNRYYIVTEYKHDASDKESHYRVQPLQGIWEGDCHHWPQACFYPMRCQGATTEWQAEKFRRARNAHANLAAS